MNREYGREKSRVTSTLARRKELEFKENCLLSRFTCLTGDWDHILLSLCSTYSDTSLHLYLTSIMADTDSAPSTAAAPATTVPFFKKKSKSSGNTATKKRAASPSTAESASSQQHEDNDRGEGPSVVRLAKKEVFNPLKQATSNKRRKQNGNNGNDDDDDDGSDYDLEQYSKPTVKYSDRNVSLAIKQKDEEDKILSGEAALAKSGEQTTGEADGDDGLYKGKSAYQSQLPTGSQKFAPIKGPSSDIRTITLMDYQPDRCKDYAE